MSTELVEPTQLSRATAIDVGGLFDELEDHILFAIVEAGAARGGGAEVRAEELAVEMAQALCTLRHTRDLVVERFQESEAAE